MLLARDRVQKRAALAGHEAGFQCTGHGRIDAKRDVHGLLDDLDQRLHQRRLDKVVVGIARVFRHHVGEDRTRVYVKYRGPAGNLFQRVTDDGLEVALLKLGREFLASGGIDPFADHTEGFIESDDHGFRFGFNDSAGHT